MLTTSQRLAASSRVPDGDTALLDRVPITSATGRYDDGIPDIDPATLDREQAEAQHERLRRIARDEQTLGRKPSMPIAPAVVVVPQIPEAVPFAVTPENRAAVE